jgi:hypothetical protein
VLAGGGERRPAGRHLLRRQPGVPAVRRPGPGDDPGADRDADGDPVRAGDLPPAAHRPAQCRCPAPARRHCSRGRTARTRGGPRRPGCPGRGRPPSARRMVRGGRPRAAARPPPRRRRGCTSPRSTGGFFRSCDVLARSPSRVRTASRACWTGRALSVATAARRARSSASATPADEEGSQYKELSESTGRWGRPCSPAFGHLGTSPGRYATTTPVRRRQVGAMERKTGFEPATLTLAR